MIGRLFSVMWLSLVLCAVNTESAQAQDIHYTLYDLSPQTLNPANAGLMRGNLRFNAIYRDQWRSINGLSDNPFTTGSAGLDGKVHLPIDNIGLGLVVVTDRSGPGFLMQNRAYGTFAYQMRRDVNTFALGVQPGYTFNSFQDYTYPVQYDPETGRYNVALPNGESSLNTSKSYMDLNAGFAYSRRGQIADFYVGFAVFHILEPDASFSSNTTDDELKALPRRYSVNFQSWVSITQNIFVMPSVLFMLHQGASQLTPGVQVGYRLSPQIEDNITLRAGAFMRNNILSENAENLLDGTDAVAATFGLTYKMLEVGVAYDFNISNLEVATNKQGGFELGLVIRNPFEAQDLTKTIPCHRY